MSKPYSEVVVFDEDSAAQGRSLLLLGGVSLYHTGLQWVIESRSPHRVVARAADDDERPIVSGRIDLVVLDCDNPGRVRDTVQHYAPVPVILICDAPKAGDLTDLLHDGVAAVVLKTSDCDALLEVIDEIAGGVKPVGAGKGCAEAGRIAHLTAREKEIITVICSGLTNRQAGDRLHISEATVRHHLSSIFAKLDITNRGELIVFGFRHKLADIHAAIRDC
jgi:DNA-binding NarL/FixJ family response regulator